MATYKKPGSLAVSQNIDKPGWYHFMVNSVDDPATKQDGTCYDAIRPNMTCVGGQANPATDTDSQLKKGFAPLLFNPSESHKDGGEFASKVHLRFADACNVNITPDDEGNVDIDWSKVKAQQIIAAVDFGRERDGKRHLEIDGAHIYHVDDPEVKHIPKNAAALTLIPPALRRAAPKAASGAATKTAANGTASKSTAAGTGKPAPTTPSANQAAAQQQVNLDDV